MLLGPLGRDSHLSHLSHNLRSPPWKDSRAPRIPGYLVDTVDGSLDAPEALRIKFSVRLMVADAAEIALGTDAILGPGIIIGASSSPLTHAPLPFPQQPRKPRKPPALPLRTVGPLLCLPQVF